MTLEPPVLTPEQRYAQEVPYGYRKRLGQFFTPPEVARFMVQWATAQAPQTFLDPAVGAGIFLEVLASASSAQASPPAVTAFDIDPVLVMLARERYRLARQRSGIPSPDAPPARVVQRDFLTAEITDRFDAIVCNPPYIRHHDLSYSPTLFRHFDTLAGRRLSRNTNAYGLFLVKIQSLLSPAGRAAVITPSEFLNADFGVGLKACLLATNALHALIVFHHGLVLFDDLLTTACITLLSRQRAPEEPIHLVEVADLAALERLPAFLESSGSPLSETWGSVSHLSPQEFDAAAKWRSLKARRARPQASPWVPFSELARIMRGIATGANAFFTLTQAEVDEWGLEERFLRPCLSKAPQARGLDFTREDWETLRRAQKKVWLLYCTGAPSFAVAAYLRAGEQQGLHRRYLTRHRTPWYAPEQREVAPLWVTTFGRTGLRFVRNRARVWNLTACHGIYPHFDDPTLLSALMAYLTSPLAAEKLAWELRTYGDGLLKVEPRDVLRLPVLDVRALPGAEVAELANLFDELCRQQRFESPEAMADTRTRITKILQKYSG